LKKSRLACRGVVLIERFLDVGEDQFERLSSPSDIKPTNLAVIRRGQKKMSGKASHRACSATASLSKEDKPS
jgi:hypothetical protein